MESPSARKYSAGFTLLEVMVVLLIIGISAGLVMFNAFGASPVDRLKEEVSRLQVITDMASDYAVLNQQEMGLRIDELENRYVFMFLDENDQWQELTNEPVYAPYVLPEPYTMTLLLEDLPWDTQDQLFDRELFDETLSVSSEGVQIGDEEDEPPPPPQILIMSSGEVTPFSLTFNFEPEYGNQNPAYFVLNNQEMPPFEVQGPLEQPL